MPKQPNGEAGHKVMPLWGGIEATVNRVGDRFFDQFERNGHPDRPEDFDRIAGLGVRALRIPVLWERVTPHLEDAPNWDYPDRALEALQARNIEPIVGLVHHGSGPFGTDLLDPEFPDKLARYARQVAERYPWVTDYTPVNEPLTTARFSALYGHWYPHAQDEHSFTRALLNQVRATILAMRAIREVNPNARLIQTDDLGKVHATDRLQYQADFENERRWLTWDLLTGRAGPETWMGDFLHHVGGVSKEELEWFVANPCPPDVIGVNHYVSSERFLDHRTEHYPPERIGGNGRDAYVDVVAARVREEGCDGFEAVLMEAWERYQLPVAVTECHLGCTREEQVRWLVDSWESAQRVRDRGAEIVGFTVWSLFGAYDWNSLLTQWNGHYEPGVFDLRAPEPRPTALAAVMRELAEGRIPHLPYVATPGWWERPLRFEHPPCASLPRFGGPVPREIESRPVVIVGQDHLTAEAFAEACEMRGLAYQVTTQGANWIKQLRPWAVVDLTADPAIARAALHSGSRLLTFTMDSGQGGNEAEVEPTHDERWLFASHPDTLLVRTGPLFGGFDESCWTYQALMKIGRGEPLEHLSDRLLTPSYLPDLVHLSLDLLVDDETGPWHLAHPEPIRISAFLGAIAEAAGLPDRPLPLPNVQSAAVLSSERGWLMPPLPSAILHYAEALRPHLETNRRFAWR